MYHYGPIQENETQKSNVLLKSSKVLSLVRVDFT